MAPPITGQIFPNATGEDGQPDVPFDENVNPSNGQPLLWNEVTQKYAPGDPIVSGPDAVGTAPTRPPVQIGGVDDAGLVREVHTDVNGNVKISNLTVEELLRVLILEIRALKTAVIALDDTALPTDFDSSNFDDAIVVTN